MTLRVFEGKVRLSVRDSGPGIAPEDLPRVFDAFRQLDHNVGEGETGGSGLGLAISKELATEMQGEVGVESRLGQGCTFWLSLPAHQPAESETLARHEPRRHDMGVVLDPDATAPTGRLDDDDVAMPTEGPLVLVWTIWPTCAGSSARRSGGRATG